ncbi:MAG: Flp pilus assembly protein CpaB [Alphaproteobacteria bacterium]|nr:MAG: Flp pilus assembly protein CpaB [Alphaproteobacteria bacterium]
MKSLIFIAICAVFLGSASYLGSLYFFGNPAPAQKIDNGPTYALALTGDQDAGRLLGKDDIEWRKVPDRKKTDNLLIGKSPDASRPARAVLIRSGLKDDFLERKDYLLPEEKGYLAALVGEGMRAATIPVENYAAYSAILHPGDHVDLILRYTVTVHNGASEIAVRTLLRNVRLIDTDGHLSKTKILNKKTGTGDSTQVTLAVKPSELEILALAEEKGTFRLVPRGSGKALAGVSGPSELRERDLFPKDGAPDVAVPRIVRVMRGSDVSVLTLGPVKLRSAKESEK